MFTALYDVGISLNYAITHPLSLRHTLKCKFLSIYQQRKGTACAEIYLAYEVNFPLFAFQISKVHTALILYGLE